MIIIVSGGRKYRNQTRVYKALDAVHAKRRITLLIQGFAQGADKLARAWAISRGVSFLDVPADWELYGKAAGPIRNSIMVDHRPKPKLVIAFPGSRGTADLVRQAKKARIKVWRPYRRESEDKRTVRLHQLQSRPPGGRTKTRKRRQKSTAVVPSGSERLHDDIQPTISIDALPTGTPGIDCLDTSL